MEISIESKSCKFSTIISSVSFRVVEVGRRWSTIVNLKLNETVWDVSFLRTVHVEGFHVGRWQSRKFGGRFLPISCGTNKEGQYVEFEIFRAKKRLRNLIIPAGRNLAGLNLFAKTMALTTAGSERRSQEFGQHPRVEPTVPSPKWALGGRSFAAVVASGGPSRAAPFGGTRREAKEQCWRVVKGLNPVRWNFDA